MDSLNELMDIIYGLLVFMVFVLLITTMPTEQYENAVAGCISTKASSAVVFPYAPAPMDLSADEAFLDAVCSPESTLVLVNGMTVNPEWMNGAREHDPRSLALLQSIFSGGTWKKSAVVGTNGEIKSLIFLKGGISHD